MGKIPFTAENIVKFIFKVTENKGFDGIFTKFIQKKPVALISATRTCEGLGIAKPTSMQRAEQESINTKNAEKLCHAILMNGFSVKRLFEVYYETVRDDKTGEPLLNENGEIRITGNRSNKIFIATGEKTIEDERALFDFCIDEGRRYRQNTVLFVGLDGVGVFINLNSTDDLKPYVAFTIDDDGNRRAIYYGEDEKTKYGIVPEKLGPDRFFAKINHLNGRDFSTVEYDWRELYIPSGPCSISHRFGKEATRSFLKFQKQRKQYWDPDTKRYDWSKIDKPTIEVLNDSGYEVIAKSIEQKHVMAFISVAKTCEALGIKDPTLKQRQEQQKINEENSVLLLKELETNKIRARGVEEEYFEIIRDDITGKPIYDENGNVKKQLTYIDSFLIHTTSTRTKEKDVYDFCKREARKYKLNRVLFIGLDRRGVYINIYGDDDELPYIAFITDKEGNEHTIAYGEDEKNKYALPKIGLDNGQIYRIIKNKNGKELELENVKVWDGVSSSIYRKYYNRYLKKKYDDFDKAMGYYEEKEDEKEE